jgi:DNA-binding transcriptional regulator YdaS (Cro superfamily)
MTTKDAVDYFGGVYQLAQALSIWPQSIYQNWGEYPPLAKQLIIEQITDGELKAQNMRQKAGA